MNTVMLKTIAFSVLATLGVLLVIGLVIMFGGFYNIAASEPHTGLTRWMFNTTMERSVKRHADATAPDLSQYERIVSGAGHFNESCVFCHGGPGHSPTHVANGLNPTPPALEHITEEFTDSQLHWISAHGVKMTGMPAFVESHSTDELWDIVAFLNRMEGMSSGEYDNLVSNSGGEEGHEHDNE